ncbi:unnamed protein product [Leptidea sinapis]|uniref:Uncharacterized protein n=1 Tax=Leptidea sinapis TaxID=189913 RepID=A0A5E4PWZ6_9NEOP|nr:unnamed protein product [Leptidea sinapis]
MVWWLSSVWRREVRAVAAPCPAAGHASTPPGRTHRWARTASAGTPGPPAPSCGSTWTYDQLT